MSKQHLHQNKSETGAALVSTMLIMALLLVLALGISLTSISELGVSSAYSNQTRAFEAAEAGLNHAAILVSNFSTIDTSSTAPAPMTQLLALRGATFPANLFPTGVFDPKWLVNFAAANPTDPRSSYFYSTFSDATKFTTGSVAIPWTGLALKDVNGNPTGASYRVAVIDDEAANDNPVPPNPAVPNFNPPVPTNLAGWHEDGDPTVDQDKRIVVYSTGTYANTSVTLEGWVGFVPYPALLSNGDIAAGGNSSIDGTYGSVHSNANLTISGSATIAQSATATGTLTGATSTNVGGYFAGGQPPIYMPKYVTNDPDPQIQNYLLQYTDILLIDPGFASGADTANPPTATDNATQRLKGLAVSVGVDYGALRNELIDPTVAQAITIQRKDSLGNAVAPPTVKNMQNLLINGNPGQVSDTGWSYSGGSWGLPPNTVPAANIIPSSTPPQVPGNNTAYTFYVVGVDNYGSGTANGGNVFINGNAGSILPGGIELTVFATGSITLGGTPNMQAHLRASTPELPPYDKPSILFVCTEDVKSNGDLGIGSRFNGIIYLGEQFNLSGNGSFNGQVLGKNNTDISGSPVDSNQIWGHFTLTLNTGGMIGTVKIISWRQIKD